jgi:hypothetical protein
MDCHAKTASRNVGLYRHGGLVVDPTLSPHSFFPDKLNRAVQEWNGFILKHPLEKWRLDAGGRSLPEGMQPAYCVNTDVNDLDHYGCLLYMQNYLHGDYDLYDVVLADAPTRNLAVVGSDPDQPSTRGPYLTAIQEYINPQIGVDMVQHGAQAQGFGHIDDDTVDVFPPKGDDFTIPNNAGVIAWYAKTFPGRKPIDLGRPQSPVPRGGRLRLVR